MLLFLRCSIGCWNCPDIVAFFAFYFVVIFFRGTNHTTVIHIQIKIFTRHTNRLKCTSNTTNNISICQLFLMDIHSPTHKRHFSAIDQSQIRLFSSKPYPYFHSSCLCTTSHISQTNKFPFFIGLLTILLSFVFNFTVF